MWNAHHQQPTRREDSADLPERERGIGQMLEHVESDDGVEGGVSKWKRLGVTLNQG